MNTATSLLTITDGRACVGWIIARGKRGYESFSADERSLGVFSTQAAAVDECMKQKVVPAVNQMEERDEQPGF
jgi:hypothetical protein